MADGPTHYREAERLEALARQRSDQLNGTSTNALQAQIDLTLVSQMIALAQVHATLALAAAQALSVCGTITDARDAWLAVVQP